MCSCFLKGTIVTCDRLKFVHDIFGESHTMVTHLSLALHELALELLIDVTTFYDRFLSK